MINPTFYSRSHKRRCYGNHSVRWRPQRMGDSNVDTRFNTADDCTTSDINVVNVGPVIPEFCRRVSVGLAYTGLCHASSDFTFLKHINCTFHSEYKLINS